MTQAEDWPALRRDCTIMDDEAVLALNKPTGLSVMGERHDTDLVRIAESAGDKLYPVHRIDKATSGLVLLTKRLEFHGDLTRQFNRRSVDKTYLAITRTKGLPAAGSIDLPLSTGRKNRVRVAAPREAILAENGTWSVPQPEVFTHVKTYPSQTRFVKLWENRRFSLLAVRPVTGRRHQIRVHLAWIGHAIHCDPLFDKDNAGRMLLHSWRLGIDATWRDGARVELEAAPGPDFWEPVDGIDAEAVLARGRAADLGAPSA